MKGTHLYLLFTLMSVRICHTCLNFTIYNVTFSAKNFEYMLHWSNDGLSQDVSFNVQYKRYGQPEWWLLHDCQNITRVYCNLTNAITDDEEYFMENQYFGRVRALTTNCTSDWFISKRLNPRDDTYLVLPKLNYIQHVNSITLVIPSPSVPISGKHMQPVTVEDLYEDDHFYYHLNFFDPEKQHTRQETQTHRMFEVPGLSPDMEYNGSIYISIGNKRKSDIQYFVVKTLPDHSLVTLIASLVAIFVTILAAGLVLFSCKYVKQKVQTPNSLVFTKSTGLPLMSVPKEKVINACSVGFCPAIFMKNYEQSHKETSRNIWKEISGNSQLQMYASQSHSAMTPGQDSAVDTRESYCSQNNTSSLVSSVHYGEVFQRTSISNKSYLQNTTPNSCSTVSSDFEGHFQINTHQPFAENDGDMSIAFVDDPFKFDLFSSLLTEGTNTILNSIPPKGLISSVTVRNDGDFTAQMEQTEEHPPILLKDLDGLTSNLMEEHNMQHILSGHGSSYILQCPIENSTTSTLDTTNIYKKQCIL